LNRIHLQVSLNTFFTFEAEKSTRSAFLATVYQHSRRCVQAIIMGQRNVVDAIGKVKIQQYVVIGPVHENENRFVKRLPISELILCNDCHIC